MKRKRTFSIEELVVDGKEEGGVGAAREDGKEVGGDIVGGEEGFSVALAEEMKDMRDDLFHLIRLQRSTQRRSPSQKKPHSLDTFWGRHGFRERGQTVSTCCIRIGLEVEKSLSREDVGITESNGLMKSIRLAIA